jgi:c(7)-type cytochrome triheme protein
MTRRRTVRAALGCAAAAALAANVAAAAPGDTVFEREGGAVGIPAAVFPHWVHRVQYRCDACHPRLFEMRKGAAAITMQKIDQGEYCGECHNGSTAFKTEFQTCARCHVPPPE